MENDLEIIKNEEIKDLIYTIRGKQVMLDSDVANLYNYKTKVLNLTVRRNIERFPEEFCFKLTESELKNLRFQFETSKEDNISYFNSISVVVYLT
ncbi:MAG: ORF6N domain-containing protein [Clostridia bacterium]|nr:ORF6N domain-containing protein [Clostridia bacterium]